MSVQGPCPSQQAPIPSMRSRLTKGEARQTLERNQVIHKKSQESVRDDDSLTSLEWLSALGNPVQQAQHDQPSKYNTHDLVLLAFRLARQPVLTVEEIAEMTCRLNPQLQKDEVLHELHNSKKFVFCHNGWKLASNGMPSEAKKRKMEHVEHNHPNRFDKAHHTTGNTIDIVIDRSAIKRQQPQQPTAAFCPDLNELLNEIGLPQQSLVGNTNPFMQSPSETKVFETQSPTSMAHHLPLLEIHGERIPTPSDWSREDNSMGQISSPDSHTDELLITDVETPYLVESWLQDTFLDYSN